MTIALGISAFYHDSAAAIVRDGEIVAAAQEERFTRKKHDANFPVNALRFCVQQAGVAWSDIDFVTFYEKPFLKFERLLETYLAFAPKGFGSFRMAMPLWLKEKLFQKSLLIELLRAEAPDIDWDKKLRFTEHHESHAASAFYPSPFSEAAILTMDGVGEWATTSLALGRGNRLEILREIHFPHSLGLLYSAFTYYTGFKVNSGEYKLMGLAPYGKARYVDVILDTLVDIQDDGSLWLDMSYFDYCHGTTMTSSKFHDLFGGRPRRAEERITQQHMDLAASIQVVCELAVMRTALHAHRLTGMKNLAMAGGVALNCVANGRLLREGPFERIWVQPAAGDAGGALGAALLVWHEKLGHQRTPQPEDCQRGSLLGPSYKPDEVGLFLDSVGARYVRVDDEQQLLDRIVSLLTTENTVGWFQGRMEYGPRALGSRSILADPRSPRIQQELNLKVKFRESFRPFAPCVLREEVATMFVTPSDMDSPYMLMVAPVRDELRRTLTAEERRQLEDPDLCVRVSVPRSSIPAVTHVDGSARVQTVDRRRHGRVYDLLHRFHATTGCPVLVNTSFNIRGEPIVCTPEDAYRCFLATNIDCLVIENYVLMKAEQPIAAVQDAQAYRMQFSPD
jgi:carbamoyltransferase